MTSAIAQLHRLRAEPLVRQPHPRARDAAGCATLDRRRTASAASRRTRRSSRRRWRPGTDYDEQLREVVGGRRVDRRRVLGPRRPPTSAHAADLLRPVYDELGRRRRLRVGRGVARPRARHRRARSRRRKELWARLDRPNVMIKIPATLEGIPAITDDARRRHQRERHADLLPRPLRGGDRGVPRRASSSASARGGDLSTHRVGRVVLREPGRHRDRPPAARGPPAARQGRGRQRQARVPAVPRALLGPALGRARGEGRAAAAAAVGVDVDEEPGVLPHALRRRAHRPRHRQHARAGVDRRAARTATATCAPTPSPKTSTTRGAVIADLADAGVDFDDVTATLEREGVDVVREVVPRRARARSRRRRAS